MLPALALFAGVSAVESSAFADGDASSALSVLPWNGVFLKVSDGDQRGTVEFGRNVSAFRYHLAVSAPLNSSSRVAAFTDENRLTAGASASLSISFSSILNDAGAAARVIGKPTDACRAFLAAMSAAGKVPLPTCSEDSAVYSAWLVEHANTATDAAQSAAARELGKRPVPTAFADRRFFWELGLDLLGSYDRLSVLPADAAAPEEDATKWNFRAGLAARAYWAPWFALTLKPGIEWSRSPSTVKFTRCEGVPSSSDNVTGQSCSDDALLLLASHKTVAKPYFQWALTGVLPSQTAKVTPGAELGMRWYTVGGAARQSVTLTAFLAPTIEPVVTRFGVGVEMITALADDPNGSFKSGKKWWTPFLIVGGTL